VTLTPEEEAALLVAQHYLLFAFRTLNELPENPPSAGALLYDAQAHIGDASRLVREYAARTRHPTSKRGNGEGSVRDIAPS
jgi:hypothetical protein